MDVLTESSQIDGVTAEPGPRHVTGPRVDGMVSQCHSVQHTRLAGAISAVDQGDGTERDALLKCKCLEVGDAKNVEIQSRPPVTTFVDSGRAPEGLSACVRPRWSLVRLRGNPRSDCDRLQPSVGRR